MSRSSKLLENRRNALNFYLTVSIVVDLSYLIKRNLGVGEITLFCKLVKYITFSFLIEFGAYKFKTKIWKLYIKL